MIPYDMMGAAMEAPPGQAVFNASAVWTVPAGVTRVSMVCVQPGGSSAATQVELDGVVVCRALNGSRIGDGGGDGGDGGYYVFDGFSRSAGGGGGAGGYAGNGGLGGTIGSSAGRSDSGGNGGRSGRQISDSFPDGGSKTGSGGHGIGLNGIGSSPATTPDGLAGGSYGGGAGGQDQASGSSRGGACAWRNDVALAPGRQVQVIVPAAASWPPQGAGAVRILWGGGRSYPSNAGDL